MPLSRGDAWRLKVCVVGKLSGGNPELALTAQEIRPFHQAPTLLFHPALSKKLNCLTTGKIDTNARKIPEKRLDLFLASRTPAYRTALLS
ncbi:MAG: hypothetical protein NTW52_13340 [Planctomycetota bacterium]|nr:hypothetical protein [Planctomycetota bacterium]